ncbi:hypothetical protein BH23BAC3_BH23BAC3_30930 [soil metagenome]
MKEGFVKPFFCQISALSLRFAPKEVLPEIIHNDWWYELYIPEDETRMDAFDKVHLWSDVVISLLKAYIERYYNRFKSDYLSKHMKTEWLTPDHPNFEHEYEIMIEESEERIIENVTKLAEVMRSNTFNEKDHGKLGNEFEAFSFLRHLYKPLLYINKSNYKDIVKITPVALENSEWQFVKHLKEYYLKNEEQFQDTHLCLLRNQSRKGIGFFDAHGFYPDFIPWLVDKDMQHIAFIDPKGLRQVTGFNHPKIRFFETIKKEFEPRLEDKTVNLNSFIVTLTKHHEVSHWDGGHSREEFNKNHVYFMEKQRSSYVEAILGKMV